MIILLSQVSKKDVLLVGGKAAALGEMMKIGINIPEGFVITTEAFGNLTLVLEKQIYKSFDQLEINKVAVRSSAVSEDSSSASWAGQLESYLNTTRENLIENILKCWDSVNSERAKIYAKNTRESRQNMAVIVQKMIQPKVSGVVFTVHPVTKEDKILIEAGLGLAEDLVQGKIIPDQYLVNKDGLIEEINFEKKQLLNNKKILELAELCIKLEKYFSYPLDIEWAMDKKGKIWIVQARPITTLS